MNKRGDKKAPRNLKQERQIKEKGERTKKGAGSRQLMEKVQRETGLMWCLDECIVRMDVCLCVARHQRGSNLSLGPCVHYLFPLCTSLQYFKHTQGAQGQRHYCGCHIRSDKNHNMKGPLLDLFHQGSLEVWTDGRAWLKRHDGIMRAKLAHKVASVLLCPNSFHSSDYRRICLHQHLLVLPQHVAQTEQCKRCAMHGVNTNVSLCGKQNNGSIDCNHVYDKQRKMVGPFGKGDEICTSCDKFNANAIRRVWRAGIRCHHLHSLSAGRLCRRCLFLQKVCSSWKRMHLYKT